MFKIANWMHFIGTLIQSFAYPIKESMPAYNDLLKSNKEGKFNEQIGKKEVKNV